MVKAKKRAGQKTSKAAAFKSVLAGSSARATADGPAAAAVTRKLVTFTCSNANCVVGITSGTLNFAFTGSGAAEFPVGQSDIFFRIRGSRQPVTLTTQGGTLTPPVTGTPTFSGFTTLTVV